MNFDPLKPSDYKNAFPNMDTNGENSYYVYLSIEGFEGSHEEITNLLGLEPSKIWQVGQKLFSPNGKYIRTIEKNLWEYKIAELGGSSSDLLEKYVFEVVKPRVDKINRIAKDSQVMLTLVEFYQTSFNPGYLVSREVINLLSEINCSLQFDIYCLRTE